MTTVPKMAGAPIDRSVHDTLDIFRSSAAWRQAEAERELRELNGRKAIAKALAELEATTGKTLAKLRANLDASVKEKLADEKRLLASSNKAHADQAALSAASANFSNEQVRLENLLIETSSREINLFIAEMDIEFEKALKLFAFHNEVSTENVFTGRKVVTNSNNKASVLARRDAIREARAAAEAMRLDPDQSQVSIRLQELRANLPAVAGL